MTNDTGSRQSKIVLVGLLLTLSLSSAQAQDLKVGDILNTHYNSSLTAELGKNKVTYHVTGQEERPNKKKTGDFYLLFLSANDSKSLNFTDSMPQLIDKGVEVELGGSPYKLKYKFRKNDCNPLIGDLEILAQDKSFSGSVTSEALMTALYSTSILLNDVPYRLAMFDKMGNDKEQWILLMRSLKVKDFDTCEGYKKWKRIHVDSQDIPRSKKSNPAKVLAQNLDGYEFEFAFIVKDEKEYLRVNASKKSSD